MRIERATVREVAWSLDGRGAARGRTERRGLLLEVQTATGRIGRGEASPLPGLSRDTIEDARRELAAFAARLPLELHGASSPFAIAASVASPSARFAVETALLDVLARDHGTSIADLLEVASTGVAGFAVVVDDPREAAAAREAGATRWKIKVGERSIDDDVARVRAIAAISTERRELATAVRTIESTPTGPDPGTRLRLDANRAWSRADAPAHLARFAGLPIDFVEEPCPDAHELLASPLPVPIALDESLAGLTTDQIFAALASPSLGALVLKPTLLGGFSACLALAALARAAGKPAIVTHALEGEVGYAACVELARVVGGDQAHGLAPYLEVDDRARAATAPDAASIRIATPGLETVAAVWSLLRRRDRRPLALIHHALPASEIARRRAMVEAARFDDDDAVVLFTSGSTAEARGVVLTHRAMRAAAEASAAHLGWRDDDGWFVPLSLAHAGGLAAVARCWYAHKPVVLLDGDWDRARASALLAQCTLASLVPTQLADLLSDPAWRPPAKLRAVLLGGAAASPALLEQAAARDVPFLITYGMTESFGQLATAPLARAGDPRAPLVPLAGVDLAGGTREAPAPLRVRAPMLATRYLDGEPIAPGFATRDLGFVEDGALVVVGRADDVIITGGENVHPAQVEAVLAATPGVRAACAFAVPDERWGQIVGAAVATDRLDDAILAAWHAALPAHARPRELAIVRELPLLATGKLDRRAAARLPREPVRYR